MKAATNEARPGIDAKALRGAFGHFATGVTIITTRDPGGAPIGVTASSFNTVSIDPPLILWSVARTAYSYPSFAVAEHFAVHVLDAGHQHLSERFARASSDKFAEMGWQPGMGGVPVLDGLGTFECSVEHRYDGGDHLIIVGRVLRLGSIDKEGMPLLFHRGRYAGLHQASG